MKKLLFSLLVLAVGFSACKKESDPDPTDDLFNFEVSNQQEAFVLLTTATWCSFCWQWGIPAFEVAMTGKEGINSSKVNGISLHYSSSDPMFFAMADTLKKKYGIGGPPNLWIEFDNTYNLQPAGWKTAIKARQVGVSTCGVEMNKVKEGNTYKVYTKVKFFTPQTGTYNLAIYAVENGIVANQTTTSGSDPAFIHNDVLRAEITKNNAWGTELFNGSSQSDYKFTYTYTPAANVKIDKVKFVAVIYKMSGDKPIASPNSNTK